jgi:hypothetical protein
MKCQIKTKQNHKTQKKAKGASGFVVSGSIKPHANWAVDRPGGLYCTYTPTTPTPLWVRACACVLLLCISNCHVAPLAMVHMQLVIKLSSSLL